MRLGERIQDWDRWRGYCPAAGSIVAHIVVAFAIAGLVAAAAGPAPPASPMLEVTLLAEPDPPEPEMRPPPPASRAARRADPKKSDRMGLPREPERSPAPQSAGPTAAAEGSVYLEPSPLKSGAPPGLASLMETDPCRNTPGLKLKDCDRRLEKFAMADAWQLPTQEELKRYHRAFVPVCPYKVGCEGGEWMSTNGTRSVLGAATGVLRGNAMGGGAARLGGVHEMVGRLAQNPDFIDPGFGD